ncbi:TPR repeat protein [Nitrosospira multiformis]|uniref:TPR repeat protein n=1 Tax=Nitrosospira multiformis TaxID=1231 RepID=A0A2T5I5P2_9PROT|nr:tetratricopeptide repeat protein [Nitrosospira multiformis]PTQ79146.1 TPR repeat protein [Nitrosospira multiformis]
MSNVISIITVLLVSGITYVQAAPYCGELKTAYGPYDYTNPEHRKNYLGVVEQYHFTSDVEKLIRDEQGSLGGGINYTLKTFPNHHRALDSMAKLALREKTIRPQGARHSIECYFERAIRFKPTDGMVRMIYGNYFLRAGQLDKAMEQLQIAIDLQPENPTINYNLGLLYMQKKDYEQAKTYAKKAYDVGFPLLGLKNQLKQTGKWDE